MRSEWNPHDWQIISKALKGIVVSHYVLTTNGTTGLGEVPFKARCSLLGQTDAGSWLDLGLGIAWVASGKLCFQQRHASFSQELSIYDSYDCIVHPPEEDILFYDVLH